MGFTNLVTLRIFSFCFPAHSKPNIYLSTFIVLQLTFAVPITSTHIHHTYAHDGCMKNGTIKFWYSNYKRCSHSLTSQIKTKIRKSNTIYLIWSSRHEKCGFIQFFMCWKFRQIYKTEKFPILYFNLHQNFQLWYEKHLNISWNFLIRCFHSRNHRMYYWLQSNYLSIGFAHKSWIHNVYYKQHSNFTDETTIKGKRLVQEQDRCKNGKIEFATEFIWNGMQWQTKVQ